MWIGCNALVLYVAAQVVPFYQIASRFVGGDVAVLLDRQVADGLGSLVTAAVSLLLVAVLARFLYRRSIFIRV